MPYPEEQRSPGRRPGSGPHIWLLAILATIAIVWALKATMVVTMPLAWALLIALAVWPVSSAVKRRMPDGLRWLGPTAAMLLVLGILALFLVGLGLAGSQVAQLAAEVVPRLDQRMEEGGLGSLVEDGGGLAGLVEFTRERVLAAANRVVSIVAGLVLILFLVLLMLTETRNWREKIGSIGGQGGEGHFGSIARSVGQKFRTFFLTRLLLGTITAFLYVAWLALFGVDYLLLWGVLTVLLNFLPTVGSIISGTLPVIFVLVQRDFATAGAVAAGLLVIEQVMGNFVDPKIMGRQLSLSPLVVLVSLLFWTWVWGIPGAFLAVPLTVLITIAFAHVDALKPIALLLTNERDISDLEEYRRAR